MITITDTNAYFFVSKKLSKRSKEYFSKKEFNKMYQKVFEKGGYKYFVTDVPILGKPVAVTLTEDCYYIQMPNDFRLPTTDEEAVD